MTRNPTSRIAAGIALIVVGLGLLLVFYRRTAGELAATLPPGARLGWRTIVSEQVKGAEGLDSWFSLLAVAGGAYVVARGRAARARDRELRRPPQLS